MGFKDSFYERGIWGMNCAPKAKSGFNPMRILSAMSYGVKCLC